jgi:hypothetical protein
MKNKEKEKVVPVEKDRRVTNINDVPASSEALQVSFFHGFYLGILS